MPDLRIQAKIYSHYLAEIMLNFAHFVAEAIIRKNIKSIDGEVIL